MDVIKNLQELLNNNEDFYWTTPNNLPSVSVRIGISGEGQLILKYDSQIDKYIIERNLFINNESVTKTDLGYSKDLKEYKLLKDIITLMRAKLADADFVNYQNIVASKLMYYTSRWINENFDS